MISNLRMFAGPNGSGKTTLTNTICKEPLGVYINPDDIEKEMKDRGFLNLDTYQITTSEKEVFDFFHHSTLLDNKYSIKYNPNCLSSNIINSYVASVASDFIRKKLLETSQSFTFETVMSFPDKVELLQKAQLQGYRTYLYYIATENPEINISRVQQRVKSGGHSVPEDKIISRYKRSLDLLLQAVRATHRAYIFDNSTDKHIWLAEVTNGSTLELKTDQMPAWFKEALWNKLH